MDRSNPDPATELAHRQWRESVWAHVAELPESQREALVLRFAEEMTYQQIADILGCAEGTAKTRIHHGLKRLRRTNSEQLPTLIEPPLQAVTAK